MRSGMVSICIILPFIQRNLSSKAQRIPRLRKLFALWPSFLMNSLRNDCHSIPVVQQTLRLDQICITLAGWVGNWHISMLAVVSYLAASVVLYSLSLSYSRHAPDYRDQELVQ